MSEIINVSVTPEQQAEFDAYNANEYNRQYLMVQESRRQSYQRDADPLFFGFQRGENTEQEWLDAIQAVKDANPYPSIES